MKTQPSAVLIQARAAWRRTGDPRFKVVAQTLAAASRKRQTARCAQEKGGGEVQDGDCQ